MLRRLAKHDLRAIFQRKSRDARPNCGKRDGLQAALIGNFQGMRRGTPQRIRVRLSAKLHAGGMNHESRLQFSSRGDGRVSDRNASDGVAFALDFFAAFAANRSRYASAQKQIVVGRVDDGVCVHFRQVALLDDDSLGECFHRGVNPFSPARLGFFLCSFFLRIFINAASRLAAKPPFSHVLPQ